MSFRRIIPLLICILALPTFGKTKQQIDADAAIRSFAPQLKYLLQRANESADNSRIYPISVKTDGTMKMGDEIDWRSGFFPGMLWMMYEQTGDSFWKEKAEFYTTAMQRVMFHAGSHDLGFVVNNSWGRGYQLTKEERYKKAVIDASRTLMTRFNPTVGLIRSWDFNRDRWAYPVIIDNMMNLEMLFDATLLTGENSFREVAVSHADRTLQNHFRPDASSYHVVDYDPATGERRWRGTFQGNADDSFWARGQAWGLYGYTMCYRYTQHWHYLEQAERIADFWLKMKGMPDDHIPYWDMNLPATTADTPRDASAAAVAASAFIELAKYASPRQAKRYIQEAETILQSLLSPTYLAKEGTNGGFLLMHSTGHLPGKSEIDAPLIYADYYLIEALQRLAHSTMK